MSERTESAKELAREINRLRVEIHRHQDFIYEYRRTHGIKPGEPLFNFGGRDGR